MVGQKSVVQLTPLSEFAIRSSSHLTFASGGKTAMTVEPCGGRGRGERGEMRLATPCLLNLTHTIGKVAQLDATTVRLALLGTGEPICADQERADRDEGDSQGTLSRLDCPLHHGDITGVASKDVKVFVDRIRAARAR